MQCMASGLGVLLFQLLGLGFLWKRKYLYDYRHFKGPIVDELEDAVMIKGFPEDEL